MVLYQIRAKPIVVTLLLLSVLAAVPLAYGVAVLRLGLDDVNMVRHFDHDEWGLYQAWIKSYSRGPLYAPEFDAFLSYPKLFYNTAGVFLYPYSILNGEDVSVVVTTWRALNMVFGIGAIFVLFLLVKRVFRSNWIAFIASGLFALTPEFLAWTVNSRPNPLEWLLFFTALLVSVRMCEKFSFNLFLLATLAGALAFATKFGAMPILVLVPLLSLYLIWRQGGDPNRFSDIVREQARVHRYLLPALAAVMVVGAVGLLWALRSTGWDAVSLVYNWTQTGLPNWKLARLFEILESRRTLVNLGVWGGVVGLAMGVALAALIQSRMRAWVSGEVIQPRVSLYASLFAGFIIVSGAIYTIVFFAIGPAFVAHPDHFFSQIGWQFKNIILGAAYVEAGPPSYLSFVTKLGREFHPGLLAFVPILAYAAYINIKGVPGSSVQNDQRIALWGFVFLSIALFLGSKAPGGLRHILPVAGILYAFLAEVIVLEFRRLRYNRRAGAVAVALAVLVMVGAGTHAYVVYGNWDYLRFKPQDTGLQAGKWLQEQYPDDTRIMTDFDYFYLPPSFPHTANTTEAEWTVSGEAAQAQAVRDSIVSFDPDVFVLTHSQQYANHVNVLPLLNSDLVLKSRNYHLVKQFDYQRPERQRYKYRQILVYEKGLAAQGETLESQTAN